MHIILNISSPDFIAYKFHWQTKFIEIQVKTKQNTKQKNNDIKQYKRRMNTDINELVHSFKIYSSEKETPPWNASFHELHG